MDLKVPESARRRLTASEAETSARDSVDIERQLHLKLSLCPCGRTFTPYRSFQRYCCDAHRVKFSTGKASGYTKKATETRACKNCGKDFETNDDKRHYCGHECYVIHQEKRRKPKETRACLICGRDFETAHWLKRYCSEGCRDAARSERMA